MAKFSNINKGLTWYHTSSDIGYASKLVQWSLESRRMMIMARRVNELGIANAFGYGYGPDTSEHVDITPYRDELQNKVDSIPNLAPNIQEHSRFTQNKGSQLVDDYVAIIDIDAKGSNLGYEVIKLPAIPRELNWESDSSFAALKPLGRNNPLYHYTGSEDKLEFEIDWYSTDWDRTEVIKKCRKIESLSKADGYVGNPHRVMLKWGTGDVLFNGITFIILSASYRLTRFNKAQINQSGQIESTHMLPVQAYQRVILGRVTDHNLAKEEIEFVSDNII